MLDTLEEFDRATKTDPQNVLNEKLNYGSNKLFNTILDHFNHFYVGSNSPEGTADSM